MSFQTMLNEFITCDKCRYGRDLGANDWGCRNKQRIDNAERLVHKGDYNCPYAQVKEE